MVKVIAASTVENLLRPPSSVTLAVTRHSISALAAVQAELDIDKKTIYELICTAHRCILTKGNDCWKICTKALEMVSSGVSKYCLNFEADKLNDEKSVLKVLLETITCAMTRESLMQPSFLNAFINILALPQKVCHSEDADTVQVIMAHLFVRLIQLVCRRDVDPGENLKLLLATTKATLVKIEHIEFVIDEILKLKSCNVHTVSTILSFVSICYSSQLSPDIKADVYEKLVSFLADSNEQQNYHYICQLSATAMRVAASNNDSEEASALIVIGVQLAKMIEQNLLNNEAGLEAINFYESYASAVGSTAACVVYFRILFLYLQKQVFTTHVLEKFNQAAVLYPDSARAILSADERLKLILEQRVTEERLVKQRAEAAASRAAPKIDLRMNFSNYAQ